MTTPKLAHPAEDVRLIYEAHGESFNNAWWYARFDTWLAQETAQARAEALDEAAKICHNNCSWTSEKEIRALKVNP
jgi:hypothetical protein